MVIIPWGSIQKVINENLEEPSTDTSYTFENPATESWWYSLSKEERYQLLQSYFSNGGTHEAFTSDLDEFLTMLEEYSALGEEPNAEEYLLDALAEVEAENEAYLTQLDENMSKKTALYDSQLKDLSNAYDYARSNLLTRQNMQNAQLMDTLQSGMERSRRNALEAGASAGVRIADNINTLLTVQNKQSATSMETANQLAQMMVNQRNAEASVRRDYQDALDKNLSDRYNIESSTYGKAQERAGLKYGAAKESYAINQQAYDNKYFDNPLYEVSDKYKSKYSTGGDSYNG